MRGVASRALTRGRTVGGSPIEVRSLRRECRFPANLHILYVGASRTPAPHADAVPAGAARRSARQRRFTQNGGIIRLLVESDRLRFEIDNGHAQKAGLALSSQLLMLARRVT